MIPHAFGLRPAGSVGIEEELFVLAAETLEPAPFPVELLDGERLKGELFSTLVELATPVCASVEEAVRELGELRTRAKRLAAERGLVLAAAGTWPTAVPEEQPVSADEGYRRFVGRAGSPARRQYCCGLHVHVGVESPERCLALLEAVLPWLPLVLALSANSPYVAGRETGLASSRGEILGLLPRTGAPPAFTSYGEWERFVERLVALGVADSFRRMWWDVRPHPEYGTLELRVSDQPTRLEATGALAELLHALVAGAQPDGPADRGLYGQNRWEALRFGRRAELVHPDGSRLVPAPELLRELLERLGAVHLLDPLQSLDQAGEQLALGRRVGLRGLCERLVELT